MCMRQNTANCSKSMQNSRSKQKVTDFYDMLKCVKWSINTQGFGCCWISVRKQYISLKDVVTECISYQGIKKWSSSHWLPFYFKQHYVTLTATHCFEKRNLTMHINTSHKTAILVKLVRILQRKCPLVFPLTFYNCSVCLQPFMLAELLPATTVCRKPTCCFQEPPWITELRQRNRRTLYP